MARKNAEKHVERVTKELDDREIEYDGPAPAPDDLSEARLKQEWTRLQRLENRLDTREKNLDQAASAVEKDKAALEGDREALAAAREAIEEEKAALEETRADLARREAETVEKERELADREAAAEAGFAAQNRRQLEILEQERKALLESIEQERRIRREEAEAARVALQEELAAKRAEAEEQLDTWRSEIEAERDALRATETELHRRERQLTQATELLDVERQLWDERKEDELELRVADVRAQAEHFKTLVNTVESQRDALSHEVADLESKLARFSDDPDAMSRQIESLRVENERLRDEIAARPTADEAERLRAHAAERDDLISEVSQLRRSEAELGAALRRQNIAVNELELLRDERDALEQQKTALRAAIQDLKQQLGELRELDDNKLPFPACSGYDEDPDLQRPVETIDEIDLADLVTRVQGEMAAAGFYYRSLDIQLFLAGLATSRLHLLQGLSGTGKTSLPLRFAEAIGGDATIIEVQAGWRDRDDLLGYFNAFEGRFYESEFTKALYRAGTPKWANRPVIVVLDEMNLSHPEQYFGVMLSKLEVVGTSEASIELVSRPLENTPQRFVDGAELPWPRNVWFVGTANHDETTVGFADKTYDRAHVQELPTRHEPVSNASRWNDSALSVDALALAFDLAQEEHRFLGRKIAEQFRSELGPALHRLDVGWGNRIDAQMERFIPVAVAAGAGVGPAADHILNSKIIRKVRDRHDLTPEALEALAQLIEDRWSDVDPQPPQSTLASIDNEVRRLRGDFGDLTAG